MAGFFGLSSLFFPCVVAEVAPKIMYWPKRQNTKAATGIAASRKTRFLALGKP